MLYRKVHGRPEKIFIARFGEISVDEARNRATKLNAEIADGDNPAHGRRVARAEMTFGELFYQYLERHAKVNTKRWREAESKFKQYCDRDDLGRRKAVGSPHLDHQAGRHRFSPQQDIDLASGNR